MALLKRFIKSERGLETVEWSVVAALIVAGLILAIAGLATVVEARFERLTIAVTTQ